MGSSFVLALALALRSGSSRRGCRARVRRGDQSVLLRRRLDADLLAGAGADPGLRGRAGLAAGGRNRGGGTAISPTGLRHLVLPVATLTLASIGGYTRYIRAAMREALAPGPHPHGARQGRGRDAA